MVGQCNHKGPYKWKRGVEEESDSEGDVTLGEKTREFIALELSSVLLALKEGPLAKESEWLLEAGKSNKIVSCLEPPEVNTALLTP